MMASRPKNVVLWLLVLGFCALPSSASTRVAPVPDVRPLESLEFSISLLGIPAGTGTMQTVPVTLPDGESALQFQSVAKSNDFISFFFPVHNVVNSTVDLRTKLPRHLFFQRREGKHHEDFDVTFDHQAQQATIVKNGTPTTMAIPANVHDGLSCLYYLRQMPSLVPGKSVFVTIHHDKNNYDVEVQVEVVESIEGPWGVVEALRVLAIMPFRGIFLNEGNIRFWLTNDQDRVPLKMEARVIVGSVSAILEKGPL